MVLLVGYARTSTPERVAGFGAQLRDLEKAGCEEVFKEQVSSVAHCAERDTARKFVRRGDALVIIKMDERARSTQDLLKIVEGLGEKGVGLRIRNFAGPDVDTKSPSAKMMLTMFAAIAQFEGETVLTRQREGIHEAKRAGKYKGRSPLARAKVTQEPI